MCVCVCALDVGESGSYCRIRTNGSKTGQLRDKNARKNNITITQATNVWRGLVLLDSY